MTLGTFAYKRLRKIYVKTKNGVVTYDKKNLPWFVVGYDFYPTCCVSRLRDRKHKSLD